MSHLDRVTEVGQLINKARGEACCDHRANINRFIRQSATFRCQHRNTDGYLTRKMFHSDCLHVCEEGGASHTESSV